MIKQFIPREELANYSRQHLIEYIGFLEYISDTDNKKEYLPFELIAAKEYGISPEFLGKKTKFDEVVKARQICMCICCTLKMTLTDAGKRYNRDHATVIHAKNTMANAYTLKDYASIRMIEILEKTGYKEQVINMLKDERRIK